MNVEKRVDGVVENYFLEGSPSLTKEPYISWTTDNEKLNHVGDTYTNIEEFVDEDTTPSAGKSWRWCECGDLVPSGVIEVFKYGIPDIRTIYGNDIRFLNQFDRKDVE